MEHLREHDEDGGPVLHRDRDRLLASRLLLLSRGERGAHPRELHRRLELLEPSLEVTVRHFALRADDGKHRRLANLEIAGDGFVERRARRSVITLGQMDPREHEVGVGASLVHLEQRLGRARRRVVRAGDVSRAHEQQLRGEEPRRLPANRLQQRGGALHPGAHRLTFTPRFAALLRQVQLRALQKQVRVHVNEVIVRERLALHRRRVIRQEPL